MPPTPSAPESVSNQPLATTGVLDVKSLKALAISVTGKVQDLTAKLDKYAHGFAGELDSIQSALAKLHDQLNSADATASTVAKVNPGTSVPNADGKPLPLKPAETAPAAPAATPEAATAPVDAAPGAPVTVETTDDTPKDPDAKAS